MASMHSFNSRSREGSDCRRFSPLAYLTGFNSRSREGSDFCASCLEESALFQFTLPRGERQVRSLCPCFRPCFNSRSREGSDSKRRLLTLSSTRFNSRSREGSDLRLSFVMSSYEVSIHAPARGATEL